MISLTALRVDIFRMFEHMREHKIVIEFSHRRKIYRMWIEDTGRKVETPYQIKKLRKSTPVLNAMIEGAPCKECRSLKVNGICMNKSCPSNQASVEKL